MNASWFLPTRSKFFRASHFHLPEETYFIHSILISLRYSGSLLCLQYVLAESIILRSFLFSSIIFLMFLAFVYSIPF